VSGVKNKPSKRWCPSVGGWLPLVITITEAYPVTYIQGINSWWICIASQSHK